MGKISCDTGVDIVTNNGHTCMHIQNGTVVGIEIGCADEKFLSEPVAINVPDKYKVLGDDGRWHTHKVTTFGNGTPVFTKKGKFTDFTDVTVNLPNTIRAIGKAAFSFYDYGGELRIPDSVIDIPSTAFQNCVFDTIRWSRNCTEIPNECFMNSSINKLLAVGVREISCFAFTACDLKELDLSESDMMSFAPTKIDRIKKIIPPYFSRLFLNDEELDISYEYDEKDNIVLKTKPVPTTFSSVEIKKSNFVITGTLSVSRMEFTTLINKNGGSVSNSVSHSTDYLIVGEKPGRTKLNAADRHRVPRITEYDVLNAIHHST